MTPDSSQAVLHASYVSGFTVNLLKWEVTVSDGVARIRGGRCFKAAPGPHGDEFTRWGMLRKAGREPGSGRGAKDKT